MKKLSSIITAVLFFIVIAFLGVTSVALPDTEVSKSERRYLTQFPELTWQTFSNGVFMQNLEKYLPDQFPMRDGFRQLKAVFERICLRLDSSDIYEYKGYLASLDYSFNENLVNKAGEKLTKVRDALLTEGYTAYFSVIPPKNYYIAKETGLYPVIDYENLQAQLEESCVGFEFIDIFDTLSLESYYKTDSHWRQETLGGTVERLASQMGVGEYLSGEYEISEIGNFSGVYAGQSALPADDETIYYLTNDAINSAEVVYTAAAVEDSTVYTLSKLSAVDMYDIFLGGAVPIIEITNPSSEAENELVIFRDSYGSSITPLLVECYRKITLVDLRYIAFDYLTQFIDPSNSDFLFLYSTGVLNNSEMLRVQ